MRLLVAYDGSEGARAALREAMALARAAGAEVLLLHVLNPLADPADVVASTTEAAISTGRKPSDEMWKVLIQRTLEEVQWNQTAAAKRLGISRTTLHYKMVGYGIKAPS